MFYWWNHCELSVFEILSNWKFRCSLFLSHVLFVKLKISLFLVSFSCTFCCSMLLFFLLKIFEISNKFLNWLNIDTGNELNSRSWLLYSVSLFPVNHLNTCFESFPEFEFQFFLHQSSWSHTALPAKLGTHLAHFQKRVILNCNTLLNHVQNIICFLPQNAVSTINWAPSVYQDLWQSWMLPNFFPSIFTFGL